MLSGKVAVVVGGADGCGKACCEALAKENIKLCIGDVQEAAGTSLAKCLNDASSGTCAVFQKCDVSSEADIENLFQLAEKTFGKPPEVVLNIAGYVDEFNWQKCLDINVGGNIRCINTVIKHMSKERGGPGGVYVAMASNMGVKPYYWGPVYASVKHAVVGLCRAWGSPEHYRTHGIRFNVVCPTTIDTNFTQSVSRTNFEAELTAQIDATDKLSPREVAEGFMKPVREETLNGEAIRVTKACGVDLATFPDFPAQ